MLATILLGNNIVNIAASALTTAIFIDLFESYALGIAIGVMTLLILVFGEIFPKSIAASHNEQVSCIVSAPIWYLSVVFSPILNVFEYVLNAFPKLFGLKLNARMFTEEDIIALVKLAEEEGSIKKSEKEMLENVLEFHDKKVDEIAVPLKKMVQINSKSKVKDVITIMRSKKFSRIPVYKNNPGEIIGIVYAKDLFRFIENGMKDESVLKIIKKPFFVSGNMKINTLLRKFQKKHLHMAIVSDDQAKTLGLVTIEDILEEIVGEIEDEIDHPLPTNNIQ